MSAQKLEVKSNEEIVAKDMQSEEIGNSSYNKESLVTDESLINNEVEASDSGDVELSMSYFILFCIFCV